MVPVGESRLDESDRFAPGPSKMVCTGSSRKYMKWEKLFTRFYFDEDVCGAFCSVCKRMGQPNLLHIKELRRCLGGQALEKGNQKDEISRQQ